MAEGVHHRVRVALIGTGVEPIPPTGYGGVERTLAELAEALTEAGEEVRVVQSGHTGTSLGEYWFSLELPGLLGRAAYDVVHASTPVVANRLAVEGIPFVYTTHSRHWFVREGLRQRWGAYLERRAVRQSAHTIALTPRIAERLRAEVPRLPADHVTVIPIGVDPRRFAPSWSERTGVRALGVGVVAPIKRWELAARCLQDTGLALRIAGPMQDAGYAAAVRAAGEDVELLGEVDDHRLASLYAESDLYVHPSAVELLPGAVLQAMASGLPVLGTEAVQGLVTDGVTGYTTPPGATADRIVGALHGHAMRLANDAVERRRLGEAARERAMTDFSWPVVAAAHQALYRRLLAGGALSRR